MHVNEIATRNYSLGSSDDRYDDTSIVHVEYSSFADPRSLTKTRVLKLPREMGFGDDLEQHFMLAVHLEGGWSAELSPSSR